MRPPSTWSSGMVWVSMVVVGQAAEAQFEGGLIPAANRLIVEDIPRDCSKLLLPLFLPPLCMMTDGTTFALLLSRLFLLSTLLLNETL